MQSHKEIKHGFTITQDDKFFFIGFPILPSKRLLVGMKISWQIIPIFYDTKIKIFSKLL